MVKGHLFHSINPLDLRESLSPTACVKLWFGLDFVALTLQTQFPTRSLYLYLDLRGSNIDRPKENKARELNIAGKRE